MSVNDMRGGCLNGHQPGFRGACHRAALCTDPLAHPGYAEWLLVLQRGPDLGWSWRCEGLSLLHNIGDQNSGLGVARLATGMGRSGRYLEGIAYFECAGRLTLYGKL